MKKAWNIILSFKLKCTLDYGSHFADLFHNPAWPFPLQTLSLSDLLSKCQRHVALPEINNSAPHGGEKKPAALATCKHICVSSRDSRDTLTRRDFLNVVSRYYGLQPSIACRNTKKKGKKKKKKNHPAPLVFTFSWGCVRALTCAASCHKYISITSASWVD